MVDSTGMGNVDDILIEKIIEEEARKYKPLVTSKAEIKREAQRLIADFKREQNILKNQRLYKNKGDLENRAQVEALPSISQVSFVLIEEDKAIPEVQESRRFSAEEILKIRYDHPDMAPLIKESLEEGLTVIANNCIKTLSKIYRVGRATIYRNFERKGIKPETSRLKENKDYSKKEAIDYVLGIYFNNEKYNPIVIASYKDFINENDGNIVESSKKLKIPRITVYRHLRQLKIPLKELRKRR